MTKWIYILSCCLFTLCVQFSEAQSHEQSIYEFREHYKAEFLKEERSPLKRKQIKHLRFFLPDSQYCTRATFKRIMDTLGFDMKTHTTKLKKYVVYGELQFTLFNKPFTLLLYQSVDLRTKEGLEDYLFLPFTDLTNGNTTYGGGRYIDVSMKGIENGTMQLDFNRAYNPYCAYKLGYSCPIPPKENALALEVNAGEKRYKKEPKE